MSEPSLLLPTPISLVLRASAATLNLPAQSVTTSSVPCQRQTPNRCAPYPLRPRSRTSHIRGDWIRYGVRYALSLFVLYCYRGGNRCIRRLHTFVCTIPCLQPNVLFLFSCLTTPTSCVHEIVEAVCLCISYTNTYLAAIIC